jgi:uncharacterized membrane protein YphA (DoxX/SURF4 family)
MNKLLWVVQILLAALFLFSGVSKFMMPAAELTKNSPLSLSFIRFIGVCEIVGAIGLIVPGLTRIKPGLTPLAAAGLLIIMIGAVAITVNTMGIRMAMVPFVVGVLTLFVAWGRWRAAPLAS